MTPKISLKQIIISCITALVCGAMFAIVIPIAALFFIDVFVTFVSLFDPLHQGNNIDAVWSAFVPIIIVQTIFPLLASLATGISISYLTNLVKNGWVYLIGTGISVLIYFICQFISIGFVGLFANELIVISWAIVSLAIVGGFSILTGLICVGVNRKISEKNGQNS